MMRVEGACDMYRPIAGAMDSAPAVNPSPQDRSALSFYMVGLLSASAWPLQCAESAADSFDIYCRKF